MYLPDLPERVYQDIVTTLQDELTYTFGGCTTVRGLEGNYLSHAGTIMPDRITVIYTDLPFGLALDRAVVSRYADRLKEAALEALSEEEILVAVHSVWHSE